LSIHPALEAGRVAVVTGAADGIGLAVARRLAAQGLRVAMADVDAEKLGAAADGIDGAIAIPTDVARLEEVERLRDRVLDALGPVDLLMNNAGVSRPTGSWSGLEGWRTVLGVNLWGIVHGVHAFVPGMVERGEPALVINTGSKQGITCPPGNPAYNVSKSGVKTLTEALEHELRNTEGCRVRAHLLVPGFTYTGMIRRFAPEKPEGAWTPEQLVDFLLESIGRGDFYVLCPDNDVPRVVDEKRMAWAMGDLIENRPPLSRWHPDYEAAFAAFMGDGDET
jgi:NAD(P)-dependent dehydrogenase (short-subunit alcohol dehydrogenase family)